MFVVLEKCVVEVVFVVLEKCFYSSVFVVLEKCVRDKKKFKKKIILEKRNFLKMKFSDRRIILGVCASKKIIIIFSLFSSSFLLLSFFLLLHFISLTFFSLLLLSSSFFQVDKKARSKPMQEILARLPENMFDILIFGNDCILYEPVENWPIVECLISFYSDGFPLHKAIEYSELRKPYLINDLKMQYNLQDRRTVYRVCDYFYLFISLFHHLFI